MLQASSGSLSSATSREFQLELLFGNVQLDRDARASVIPFQVIEIVHQLVQIVHLAAARFVRSCLMLLIQALTRGLSLVFPMWGQLDLQESR